MKKFIWMLYIFLFFLEGVTFIVVFAKKNFVRNFKFLFLKSYKTVNIVAWK